MGWYVSFLAGLGLATATGAAECVIEPPPPPQDLSPAWDGEGRYVRPPLPPSWIATVRGAKDTSPFVVEFTAVGEAWLMWQRYNEGQPTKLRQRLELHAQRPSDGAFHEICHLGWRPLPHLPMFGRIRLPADPTGAGVRWQVRVFERNDSPSLSILDEDLSQLLVSGVGLDRNATITPAPLPPFDLLQPPADHAAWPCASVSAIPADAVRDRHLSLPTGALGSPATLHMFSGRHLYVRALEVRNAPVSLHIGVKPPGSAVPVVPVCTAELPATTTPGPLLVASLPWELAERTQRWEITLQASTGDPAIELEMYADRAPVGLLHGDRDRFKAQYSHAPDAYSCAKSFHNDKDPVIEIGAAFRGAYALTVNTGLEGISVAPNTRAKILDALVGAITLWRNSCVKCTPYQFSIVAVDHEVFVPVGMLRGQPDNYRATFAGHPWSDRVAPTQAYGPRMTFDSVFTKVQYTARQRSRFCLQTPEWNHGYSAPDSPLCRPTPVSGEKEMLVNIVWDTRPFPCGNKQGIVACWDGSDLIRMNLSEYSFYAGDISQVLIGTSPRRVDLIRVFGHEVGHWLGLPHLSGESNLMSDNYADARCISDNAIRRLNAIADGTVRPSMTPEALLYATP